MGRLRRLRHFTNGGLLIAASSGAVAIPARAQDAPGQITPREVVTPPAPTIAPPSTANVDTREAIEQNVCPFEQSDIRLTLSQVRFVRSDGSPLQPVIAETLAGIEAPTGEQPIRVVCDLRDRANEALNRDGWIASVQIPPQEIGSGVLELRVVTARITEIRVRGNPGPYRDVLERRIDQLRGLDPVNKRDAERALLLSGDVPGLDVQLSLRPAGTQPGDVIGELAINYRPFTVFANFQNYNARSLGRETGYVRGEYYGLTGLQDLTYVGVSSTADFEEQRIAQVGHIFGLDGQGLSFGGRLTYAWSRPDLGALDLKTDTLIAGFDIVRPLVRTVNTNLRLGVGFDYVDQDTSVQTERGTVPLNQDKLRVGFVRLSGEVLTRRGDGSPIFQLRGALEARKGFDIFDATPVGSFIGATALPSRIDGNSRAFVVRGELDAALALGRIFSIAGNARGQWTKDALLNYEEFSIGNLTIGRGYDPGANSGDRAVGLHGEVRAAVPVSNRVATEIFGFVDNVWFTNLDRASTETDRQLRSYGGGLRLTLPNLMLIEASYARPRDKALTIDAAPPTDRFLLSLTVQFRARAR